MTQSNGTHEIATEYGVRKPTGEEQWGGTLDTLSRSGTQFIKSPQQVHTDRATRADYVRHLEAVAEHVSIDPAEYVAKHRLITRQRITITLPTVENEETQLHPTEKGGLPWA